MSGKFIRIIFAITMIIFLPISFYLVQNNIITILVRNIIFAVLIGTYLLSINILVKDNKE